MKKLPRTVIDQALEDTRKVKVTYDKKTTSETVSRTLLPYERRGNVVWAEDTAHPGKIHSFHANRMRDAKVLPQGFRPRPPHEVVDPR